jgi:hypothetical protein
MGLMPEKGGSGTALRANKIKKTLDKANKIILYDFVY